MSAHIQNNTVAHSGFSINGGAGDFPGNGIGIQRNSAATPVTRDLVSGNTVNGTFNDGIQLPNTDENQVSHNSVGAAHNNGVVNYTGHRNVLSFNTARGSGAFDLFDRSRTRPCDSNTWFGNTYSTANPGCTTIGGHQVQGPAPAAAQPAFDQPAGGAQPASTAADLPGRAGAMVPR